MKHTYTATIRWNRSGARFTDGKYSRAHTWSFDGGATVPASSSPLVVPVPMSDPAGVDPEEAFVASLAACHFLFFLYFAGRGGFVVESYTDEAAGVMEKNAQGRMWMARVTLRPKIVFGGDKQPTPEQLAEMHHKSHEECYIANSVKTEVVVEAA